MSCCKRNALVLYSTSAIFLFGGLLLEWNYKWETIICLAIWKYFGTRLFSVMASESYKSGTHSFAFVTAPSEEVAKKIAQGIIKSKLAACVNIIPRIISIYEWKGEVNQDDEILMMIKTRTSRLEELTKFVKDNHPYEVCEVISSPITQGNTQYLNWISEMVPEKDL